MTHRRWIEASAVQPGTRWIYVAGINVRPEATDAPRLWEETPDLRMLAARGARIAVLSHQGDYASCTARHLDYVARALSQRLRREVRYFPSTVGEDCVRAATALQPGEIVLFGNTRFYAGEQANDLRLAADYAHLGERVVVGGFCKAHRRHASNSALCRLRESWLSNGVRAEVERLDQISRSAEGTGALVLGGSKREKVLLGLAAARRLRARYLLVGGRIVEDVSVKAGKWEASPHEPGVWRPRVVLPLWVRPAGRGDAVGWIPYRTWSPVHGAVIDAGYDERDIKRVMAAVRAAGAVAAGPLSDSDQGFDHGVRLGRKLLRAAVKHASLVLGGDSVRCYRVRVRASSGGGAALHYLANNSLPVLEGGGA